MSDDVAALHTKFWSRSSISRPIRTGLANASIACHSLNPHIHGMRPSPQGALDFDVTSEDSTILDALEWIGIDEVFDNVAKSLAAYLRSSANESAIGSSSEL